MPEIAHAFSRVLGHKVSYRRISWPELRLSTGAEIEVMTRWFDAVGYDVDIEALRQEFPWLQDFDDYLDGRKWTAQ